MKKTLIYIAVTIVVILGIVYISQMKKGGKVVAPIVTPVVTTDTSPVVYNTALNTKYISAVGEWSPKVTFVKSEFVCNVGGSEINSNGITIKKLIGDKEYCITTKIEGAAGSIYATYVYSMKIGEQIATTTFVLQFVQCANYDDPKKTECQNERASFNPDIIASDIILHSTAFFVPKSIAQEVGYVTGHITIGPFCPVERVGVPCPVPAEAYSSREVIVYASDKIRILKKGAIDANGNYKITLPSGNYWLQINPAGIGAGEKKFVTIISPETTTVDFNIDTGIR